MLEDEEFLQHGKRSRYAKLLIALRARSGELKRAQEWSDIVIEFLTKPGPQPKRVTLLLEVLGHMRFLKIPLFVLCNEACDDLWSALEQNNTIETLSIEAQLYSSKRLTSLLMNNSTIFELEIEGTFFYNKKDFNSISNALSVNNSFFSLSFNRNGNSSSINAYCERNFQRRMILPLALLVLVLLYGSEPILDDSNDEKPGFPSGMPKDLIIKLMMMASLEPNRQYCNKLLGWVKKNPPRGPEQVTRDSSGGCCIS